MTTPSDPLSPYQKAVIRHGPTFRALLWQSRQTQEARFEAAVRALTLSGWPPRGRTLLDVGCGLADLLDYLRAVQQHPAEYYGLEGVEELADEAQARIGSLGTILHGNFITQPAKLFTGSEIVVCCGSLNTLPIDDFYQVVSRLYDAAAEVLVFNHLCHPDLAQADFLYWHQAHDVQAYCQSLCQLQSQKPGRTKPGKCMALKDYLHGDQTIVMVKPA